MVHGHHIIDVRIGRSIRRARQTSKLSVATLAKRVGLQAEALVAIEAGTRRAGAAELYRLSGVLGIELRSFFNETQSMNKSNAPTVLQTMRANTALTRLVENMRAQSIDSHAA